MSRAQRTSARAERWRGPKVALADRPALPPRPALLAASAALFLLLAVLLAYRVANLGRVYSGVSALGVDLGGMIGQHMALLAPGRVRSLCSVMSSSGARHLPGPERAVRTALRRPPASLDTASLLAHQQALFHLLRSPCFPQDLEDQRKRLLAGIHRAVYPEGVVRQLAAVLADTQRAHALAQLRVPTLVVHGRQDPLLPVACGEDTARRIPGARLLTIEGMGHDLPPGVVQALLAALLPHLKMH